MTTRRKRRKHGGGLRGPGTGACASVTTRATRDFERLHQAWGRQKQASARLDSLKKFGRGDTTKARQKAVVAFDAADAAVRSASAQVDRSLAAVNKCFRRTGS